MELWKFSYFQKLAFCESGRATSGMQGKQHYGSGDIWYRERHRKNEMHCGSCSTHMGCCSFSVNSAVWSLEVLIMQLFFLIPARITSSRYMVSHCLLHYFAAWFSRCITTELFRSGFGEIDRVKLKLIVRACSSYPSRRSFCDYLTIIQAWGNLSKAIIYVYRMRNMSFASLSRRETQ